MSAKKHILIEKTRNIKPNDPKVGGRQSSDAKTGVRSYMLPSRDNPGPGGRWLLGGVKKNAVNKLSLLIIALFIFSTYHVCLADEYEIAFMAGDTSIEAGLHYKHQLSSGYARFGASGLEADDDELEYKWALLDFSLGSDTLVTGLTCEAGLTGLAGDIADMDDVGDVGAIAFNGKVGYVFDQSLMAVPLELFAGIVYAPRAVTFSDADQYLAYQVGIGFRIVQYVSVYVDYYACDLDMESDGRTWTMEDDLVRLGIVFRF